MSFFFSTVCLQWTTSITVTILHLSWLKIVNNCDIKIKKWHFSRYKNESPKSIDELDLKAAQYIKHYAAKTVRNINKQAHINEKALINLQRRRYFLTVSGVSTYILAFGLGVRSLFLCNSFSLWVIRFYLKLILHF